MSFLDHLEELRKRLMVSVHRRLRRLPRSAGTTPTTIFGKLQEPLTQVPAAGRQARLHAADRAVLPLHEGGVLRRPLPRLAGDPAAALALHLAGPLQARAPLRGAVHHLRARSSSSLGGYFGYRVLLPGTCKFFVETGKQFKQMITIDDYFSFASMIILATGLVFETPILIFFLARLGIVTPAFLMQKFEVRRSCCRSSSPRS